MSTDTVPRDVLNAALQIHAEILGTQGCCDGVPEAIAYAYAAGRASMQPKPKPPIVYVKPRGTCSVCGVERALTVDGNLRGHDAPRNMQRGFPYSGTCKGSRKPPKAVTS